MEQQKTSTELAGEYHLSRDQAEDLLTRLGLRTPGDDGGTKYSMAEIGNALEREDDSRVSAAAELADKFGNDGFVRRVVQEAFIELREKWLIDSGLYAEVAAVKESVLAKLRKTHAYQRARRAGDVWQELSVIESFEQALLDAIRERRAAESERDQSHQPVSAGDIGGTNERQTAE